MKKRGLWSSIAIVVTVSLLALSSQGKGHINIDADGAVTTLRLGSSLLSKTTINSEGHQCKVNACLHRPELLRISMQLDGGTWHLENRRSRGELSKIFVKNNDMAILKFGPLFQFKSKVQNSRSEFSMDFSIVGKDGESYQSVIMQNNKRTPALKAKIIDEADSVPASGKFEYG